MRSLFQAMLRTSSATATHRKNRPTDSMPFAILKADFSAKSDRSRPNSEKSDANGSFETRLVTLWRKKPFLANEVSSEVVRPDKRRQKLRPALDLAIPP